MNFYGVQIFSRSLAIGIDFYKQKHYECFKDSEETVKFTIYIMNNIFDALNRKYPSEGIRKNNKDIQVLMCCMKIENVCVLTVECLHGVLM